MQHKIMFVFGTRPEAIKFAPLILSASANNKFLPLVCVTSQHREMLHQVLKVFSIKPDFDLDIMKPSQDLFDITVSVMQGMKSVINQSRPDVICVQGDTTTAFAASVASFYSRIPIAHIEAGLRTGDMSSPFPEEGSRALIGRMAQYHFCPTERAKQNLIQEGLSEKWVRVTGNTVIDAIKTVCGKYDLSEFLQWLDLFGEKLTTILNDQSKDVVLITGHRRESFGAGFRNICTGIAKLARHFPQTTFIYPAHLNPNVQGPVLDMLSNIPNIYLIYPLDYLPFVALMNRSKIILTDSGGIQEEAPSLGKPVLVMRNTTERPEAVDAGTAILVGTESESIFKHASELLSSHEKYTKMSQVANPFGDGKSSIRILDLLSQFLDEKVRKREILDE